MYIIHIPNNPDIEPRLRSTYTSACKEKQSLEALTGKQTAVIDQIPTVRFRDKDTEDA